MPRLDGYRNHPDESITLLLKERSWAPVIVDPSHSVGRAPYVPSAALAAMAYGADGLIIEAHVSPRQGIGDDPKQSLTPKELQRTLAAASDVWELRRKMGKTGGSRCCGSKMEASVQDAVGSGRWPVSVSSAGVLGNRPAHPLPAPLFPPLAFENTIAG
jgi:hypothetical protein